MTIYSVYRKFFIVLYVCTEALRGKDMLKQYSISQIFLLPNQYSTACIAIIITEYSHICISRKQRTKMAWCIVLYWFVA